MPRTLLLLTLSPLAPFVLAQSPIKPGIQPASDGGECPGKPFGYAAIRTRAELERIDLLGRSFLCNDIDLELKEFAPLGKYPTTFSGVFDGGNHTIRNLKISAGNQYLGLFAMAYLREGGSAPLIKNLVLLNTRIEPGGYSDNVGALVGYMDGSARVENVKVLNVIGSVPPGDLVPSHVRGHIHVGGLVGSSAGTVKNSSFTGIVRGVVYGFGTASNDVGGAVGTNWGRIENTSATGYVFAHQNAGGLVGANVSFRNNLGRGYGTIRGCSSSADVNGSNDVGGLVGANDAGRTDEKEVGRGPSISESFALGKVTAGLGSVGGLAGFNRGTIENSFAAGSVTFSGAFDFFQVGVGGLVGQNGGLVSKSYSVGRVQNPYSATGVTAGGLIGREILPESSIPGWFNPEVFASYWDLETSGQTESAGGEGKRTVEMQSIGTYASGFQPPLAADWDIRLSTDPRQSVWKIRQGPSSNPSYPYLDPSRDRTPRIAYWWGKVNQHVEDGFWRTDPDGRSGANLNKLAYCRNWFPQTTGVQESYKLETLYDWKAAGNQGSYVGTIMTDRCIQP